MRFFRELLGPAPHALMLARLFFPILFYHFRVDHERNLERISARVFRGRPASEVIAAGERFSAQVIDRFLVPAGMARLRLHLAHGDRCVLVSRAYAWSIAPWARRLGISDVLATELEVGADGRLTGRLSQPSCDGDQKRERLLKLLGPGGDWELHAYGDGPGDFAMFGAAHHAFLRERDDFAPWRP